MLNWPFLESENCADSHQHVAHSMLISPALSRILKKMPSKVSDKIKDRLKFSHKIPFHYLRIIIV